MYINFHSIISSYKIPRKPWIIPRLPFSNTTLNSLTNRRISHFQNKDDRLSMEEFREGSKSDPTIVQALSLYDGLVWPVQILEKCRIDQSYDYECKINDVLTEKILSILNEKIWVKYRNQTTWYWIKFRKVMSFNLDFFNYMELIFTKEIS